MLWSLNGSRAAASFSSAVSALLFTPAAASGGTISLMNCCRFEMSMANLLADLVDQYFITRAVSGVEGGERASDHRVVPNHFTEQVDGRTPGGFAAGFKAFPDDGLASDQVFARIGAVADNTQDVQVGT